MKMKDLLLTHWFNQTIKPVTFILVAFFIAATPTVSHAQCSAFLQPYVDWEKASPNNYVGFKMVIIYNSFSSAHSVSYIPGALNLVSQQGNPVMLRGSGERFSDTEVWYDVGGFEDHPFNPHTTEPVSVSISVLSSNAGQVTLTYSNNTQETINMQCGSFMYGFKHALAPPPLFYAVHKMFVISLVKEALPPPPPPE